MGSLKPTWIFFLITGAKKKKTHKQPKPKLERLLQELKTHTRTHKRSQNLAQQGGYFPTPTSFHMKKHLHSQANTGRVRHSQ